MNLKKLLLFQILLFGSIAVWGQQGMSLTEFNQNRLQKQQTAMTILGTWAIGNMALSGILAGKRSGSDKYFHQMNIGWNVVNLSLAGAGLYSALHADPGSFDLFQTITQQHRFQKILLFKAGLDLGYMAGGAYLMERSRRETGKRADQFLGFGQSILLQGAFLFVFDLSTYLVMASNNEEMQHLLSGLRFSGTQFSFCLTF